MKKTIMMIIGMMVMGYMKEDKVKEVEKAEETYIEGAEYINKDTEVNGEGILRRSVILLRGGKAHCGGSWVGNREAVTANHCLGDGVVSGGMVEVGVYAGSGEYRKRMGKVVKVGKSVDLAKLEIEDVGHEISEVVGKMEIGGKIKMSWQSDNLAFSYGEGVVGGYRKVASPHGRRDFMQVGGEMIAGDSGSGIYDKFGRLAGVASFVMGSRGTAFAIVGEDIIDFLRE